MPRTTINIDQSVLDELKERAHREQRSLGELVTRLLADALRRKPEKERAEFVWHSQKMGPKVDMSDWARVKELLFAEDDEQLGYRH